MHFDDTGGTAASLITAIEANVTANMWKSLTVESSVEELIVTQLDGSSASITHPTSGGSKWAGATASGTSSPQVATLVKLTTAERGRSKRGRVFLPFTAEGAQSDGVLEAAVKTAAQTAWTAFLGDMLADSFPLVVASYKLAEATIVSDATVENLLATQRLRQPRP